MQESDKSNKQPKSKDYKCPYDECLLPDNHNHEGFQILYLTISVLMLANSENQLTPLSIFLFCVPVFADAWFFKSRCVPASIMKKVLLLISGVFILSYILFLTSIIVESPESFSVNKNNMILGGLADYPIQKATVSHWLIPLIASPALSLTGSQTKRIRDISDISESLKSA